jgi:hypothetical protein
MTLAYFLRERRRWRRIRAKQKVLPTENFFTNDWLRGYADMYKKEASNVPKPKPQVAHSVTTVPFRLSARERLGGDQWGRHPWLPLCDL